MGFRGAARLCKQLNILAIVTSPQYIYKAILQTLAKEKLDKVCIKGIRYPPAPRGSVRGRKYAIIETMKNPTLDFHKFKDALRYALIHYEDKGIKKGQALKHIAKNLINVAINGDAQQALSAIRELADRLDGKPIQAIAGVEGEPITVVQRVIVQQVVEGDTELPTHTIEPRLIN